MFYSHRNIGSDLPAEAEEFIKALFALCDAYREQGVDCISLGISDSDLKILATVRLTPEVDLPLPTTELQVDGSPVAGADLQRE